MKKKKNKTRWDNTNDNSFKVAGTWVMIFLYFPNSR